MLAVIKARGFEDALAIANNTEFGLTGSLYTTDEQKIERAREEFFVGNLYFNRKSTGAMVGVHPFGGFNMSGPTAKPAGATTCCFSCRRRRSRARSRNLAITDLEFVAVAILEERRVVKRRVLPADVRRFESGRTGYPGDLGDTVDLRSVSGSQRDSRAVRPVAWFFIDAEEGRCPVVARSVVADRLGIFIEPGEAQGRQQRVVEWADLRKTADPQVDVVKKHRDLP